VHSRGVHGEGSKARACSVQAGLACTVWQTCHGHAQKVLSLISYSYLMVIAFLSGSEQSSGRSSVGNFC
jgi:hypothetical protein